MKEVNYNPSCIQSPVGVVNPFCGTMGRIEWELVAAYLVSKSQRNGDWTSIQQFHPDYDTQGMVNRGLLRRDDSGFMLTEKAIERLVKEYPSRK
ncbi:hypothetical protein HYT23_02515 [Candidatus Pacearchaeota archaeon]|nr:hypothetical protein [Candidatus Pacearchaeota archaeon]